MKYLRKFANPSAYQSATLYYPSVSLIDSTKELMWDKEKPEVPALRLTALEDDCTLSISQVNENQVAYYSLDNGDTWNSITESINININTEQSVLFRGKILTPFTSESCYTAMNIIATGPCSVSGQLAAWINYENLNAPVTPYCCFRLFCGYSEYSGNYNNIVDASGLEFPVTTAEGCYQEMFSEGNLVTPPSILPATILSTHCYQEMFRDCPELTTSPQLPATTLVEQCYGSMFWADVSLTRVTMLATDISANSCLSSWLSAKEEGESGTIYKNSSMSAATLEAAGAVPSGWSVVDYAG